MISFEEQKKISRTRIRDAKILLNNGSYDSALYLCGYSIEVALKAIICKNLNIGGLESASHVPSTKQDFEIISKLKTHNTEDLLALVPSTISLEIKSKKFADWSTVQKWNPEMRYAPIQGRKIKAESINVIQATEKILRYLWRQI